MKTDERSKLYRALMSYNSAYNDFLSGPIIDRTNFENFFGILYFDLRNQMKMYQLNDDPGSNYTINALVWHEKEIELHTSSNKLLIKAQTFLYSFFK
ncbi:hypothetical protein P5673_031530 [Acropora cervicornis]|uniref:Uncharacterized protein n=1 Tax=Acropora cervicornis TaxID=6130 RepID=A0AAD9USI2_ACRCE|nr:hypothetical protein P5673_031530 [Acropora cervicornis]